MRRLTVMCFLAAGCLHRQGYDEDSDRNIAIIERNVTLPAGAEHLQHYRRYYGWVPDRPGKVRAIYVWGGRPDQLWLDHHDLPIVLHGGCGVIEFEFDMATRRATTVSCNGGPSGFGHPE
jgi:hypothetical protein